MLKVPKILVTGGAGYIGSHTLIELAKINCDLCVIDNFCNSSPTALRRVEKLTGKTLCYVNIDLQNRLAMVECLNDFCPDVVIHFAGLKAVGESVLQPLKYYDNNVGGTCSLLEAMGKSGCKRIVFSSSATVYGNPHYLPFDEKHPITPTNPYGRTKAIIEEMLHDWVNAEIGRKACNLRYFNPVGAHASGEIGEDPKGIPNNLMPFLTQVAVRRRDKIKIFGGDYNTPDGTGLRDYIHVVDLANAHLAAMRHLDDLQGIETFNIGTGIGVTVLQLLSALESASGREIPYVIVDRRLGDVEASFASVDKANSLLKWSANLSIADICQSAWAWQSDNPMGFKN